MWTARGGPNDISRDSAGIFYVCEQEADVEPPHTSVRDAEGAVLARWEPATPTVSGWTPEETSTWA